MPRLLHSAKTHDEMAHGKVRAVDAHQPQGLVCDSLPLKVDVWQGVSQASLNLEVQPGELGCGVHNSVWDRHRAYWVLFPRLVILVGFQGLLCSSSFAFTHPECKKVWQLFMI